MAESAARLGRSSFEVAVQLARLAVKGDPTCNECRAVLGYVLGTRGWKWEEAGRHLSQAIQADGTQVYWRLWYAEWLAVHGRLDEAWQQAEHSARLSPSEPRTHSTAAFVRYFQGRYREAIQEAEKATALNRAFQPAHYWMYRSYQQLGEDVSAIGERVFEITAWAASPEASQRLRNQYIPLWERKGREGVAHAWIHEVRDGVPLRVHRYNRAIWFAWIGDYQNALKELEAAVQARPYALIFVGVDPAFAPLRADPRFQNVVRSVGLPPPAVASTQNGN